MAHNHDSIFIALAISVAILASWTALGLLNRVRETLHIRRYIWLAATGLCMGGGIWAMHFIAMLGFNPGTAVTYDLPLTIISFMLAVLGTAGAFWVASHATPSKRLLVLAAIAMGGAIALMHYVGMAAIRTQATLTNNPLYIAAAIVVAILVSLVALIYARTKLGPQQRLIAAVIQGLAVCSMHYVAMSGVSVQIGPSASIQSHSGTQIFLALMTTAMAFVLLLAALAMAHLDRRIKLLSVLDAGDIGYWEVQLPSRHIWLSPYAHKLLAVACKDSNHAIGSKAIIDIAVAMAKKTLQNPSATGRKEAEIKIGDRWLSIRGRMIHQRREHHIKMAGVLIDITEAHSVRTALEVSDARQTLLLNELNHRLKNNFASIQSIAALTARSSPDLPTFIETFQSRLLALSNTQTLLTNTGWESADLAAIFHQELNPYTERAIIDGPSLHLDPKRALSMGLIAHELTTNAAKHGALHQAEGAIHVRWTQPAEDGWVSLEWREMGGPAVSPPKGKGFGSRLIKSSIEGPLGGSAQIDYLPGGLRVSLRFTLQDPAVSHEMKKPTITPVNTKTLRASSQVET